MQRSKTLRKAGKKSQEDVRKIITFYNLRDDYGYLLDTDTVEWNIAHYVMQATSGTARLTQRDFSHCYPNTKKIG